MAGNNGGKIVEIIPKAPEKKKLVCPLLSTGLIAPICRPGAIQPAEMQVGASVMKVECIVDECAWWSVEHGGCVKTIHSADLDRMLDKCRGLIAKLNL